MRGADARDLIDPKNYLPKLESKSSHTWIWIKRFVIITTSLLGQLASKARDIEKGTETRGG